MGGYVCKRVCLTSVLMPDWEVEKVGGTSEIADRVYSFYVPSIMLGSSLQLQEEIQHNALVNQQVQLNHEDQASDLTDSSTGLTVQESYAHCLKEVQSLLFEFS